MLNRSKDSLISLLNIYADNISKNTLFSEKNVLFEGKNNIN